MAASYVDRANTTTHPEFRDRVRVAAHQVAINVQGENPGTMPPGMIAKRQKLAYAVIHMPANGDATLDWLVWTVATWAALPSPVDAADSELFSALNAAWNDVAGVVQSD